LMSQTVSNRQFGDCAVTFINIYRGSDVRAGTNQVP
jgi:hypothetical protein